MTDKKLFSDFPEVSQEQWIAQVVKDLKGESFDEKLTYKSADGITIKPFYTAEDLAKYSERKPLFTHADWEVCVEIEAQEAGVGNKKALHELNNGATAMLFFVNHDVDLETLLNEIGIEYISMQFVVEGDAVLFCENLDKYVHSKGLDASALNISINTDPVENLLRTGDWRQSEAADQKELVDILCAHRTICINSAIYHNAGASAAYQVGCALAQANAYINWLEEQGVEPAKLGRKFQLNVSVGPDYFFEIAKLRAFRKTFALLLDEYGTDNELYIHAETATRNLTVFDTHNNLLRTTTAAMAASIGGCNSLVVKPFDIIYTGDHEFSERLARNIQLVLKAESYFDKVADVSAGSFFIEELTEQLAEKAWDYFVEIEKQGGLLKALRSGFVQQKIKDFSVAQQQNFNTGKEVLVGTNKFPDMQEDKQDKASAINWGSEAGKGKVVETLDTTRLSAMNEKERLSSLHSA
ncbi:MAG: methylmalonyl-CoA mutase subunit beta [Bacteroidota bacterium]